MTFLCNRCNKCVAVKGYYYEENVHYSMSVCSRRQVLGISFGIIHPTKDSACACILWYKFKWPRLHSAW